MGMEFWLIPVLAMLVAGITMFYLVIRRQGGSGARGEGHIVVDKPTVEQTSQTEWNYYRK